MTSPQPIHDIIKWSDQKLQLWQRDALRRLACSGSLTAGDQAELLAMVKKRAGLAVAEPPPPVALAKSHFSGAVAGAPLKLLAVRDVQNVNRLAPAARLDFAPDGVTVIYGRNGSGKSSYVRILRSACRTRIESATNRGARERLWRPRRPASCGHRRRRRRGRTVYCLGSRRRSGGAASAGARSRSA